MPSFVLGFRTVPFACWPSRGLVAMDPDPCSSSTRDTSVENDAWLIAVGPAATGASQQLGTSARVPALWIEPCAAFYARAETQQSGWRHTQSSSGARGNARSESPEYGTIMLEMVEAEARLPGNFKRRRRDHIYIRILQTMAHPNVGHTVWYRLWGI